jgi:hypothetical protein
MVLKRPMELSSQAARYLRSNARLKCPFRVKRRRRPAIGQSLLTPNERTSSDRRHVRFVPMGDIERFFELKEVANRGLISRRYPTVVSAGPFCELDDFRTDGCLKEPTRRSGPFLSTYRCRSFGRMAPGDFCHPLQEPDSAGPVSDHRRAADPASDPTVDLADRADSGSSWRFLSWEPRLQRFAVRVRS